jgi:hypothetical protein
MPYDFQHLLTPPPPRPILWVDIDELVRAEESGTFDEALAFIHAAQNHFQVVIYVGRPMVADESRLNRYWLEEAAWAVDRPEIAWACRWYKGTPLNFEDLEDAGDRELRFRDGCPSLFDRNLDVHVPTPWAKEASA